MSTGEKKNIPTWARFAIGGSAGYECYRFEIRVFRQGVRVKTPKTNKVE